MACRSLPTEPCPFRFPVRTCETEKRTQEYRDHENGQQGCCLDASHQNAISDWRMRLLRPSDAAQRSAFCAHSRYCICDLGLARGVELDVLHQLRVRGSSAAGPNSVSRLVCLLPPASSDICPQYVNVTRTQLRYYTARGSVELAGSRRWALHSWMKPKANR